MLSYECSASVGTIWNIIHHKLHLKKLCSKFVPHFLSAKEKKQRKEACVENLYFWNSAGPRKLGGILEADEAWFWSYGIGNRKHNLVWMGEDDERPEVFVPGFSRKKWLLTLFNNQGLVAIDVVPKNNTVNATYFTRKVLPKAKRG